MRYGETWLIDLSDTKGHEQRGDRPALIMGTANGLVVVVPFTTNLNTTRFSHTYPVSLSTQNGLLRESVALVFQVVALDQNRFIHKVGYITGDQWQAVTALAKDLMHLND